MGMMHFKIIHFLFQFHPRIFCAIHFPVHDDNALIGRIVVEPVIVEMIIVMYMVLFKIIITGDFKPLAYIQSSNKPVGLFFVMNRRCIQ